MAECKDKKRVLVTGATGLLGRAVVKAFEGAQWDVLGLGLSRSKVRLPMATARAFD
jgi:nucleoside-diphosphate-sugar epimerase